VLACHRTRSPASTDRYADAIGGESGTPCAPLVTADRRRAPPDVWLYPVFSALVFVYNADSSPWSKLLDVGHKLISPSTYPCHLCALTYGVSTMRRQWARFVDTLSRPVRFAYRDQLRREGISASAAPALLEQRDGAWVTLLGRADIEACRDLDALIARMREVI
jgi:hypothetical protein